VGSISNLVEALEKENFYLKKSSEIMANVIGKNLYRYEYSGRDSNGEGYDDNGYVIAKNTDEAVEIIGYSENVVMCTVMSMDEFITLINHSAVHRIF
jgi:hypothetical protein